MVTGTKSKLVYSIGHITTPWFFLIGSFFHDHKFGFWIQKTDPANPDKVSALSSRQAELSTVFFSRKLTFASPLDFRAPN